MMSTSVLESILWSELIKRPNVARKSSRFLLSKTNVECYRQFFVTSTDPFGLHRQHHGCTWINTNQRGLIQLTVLVRIRNNSLRWIDIRQRLVNGWLLCPRNPFSWIISWNEVFRETSFYFTVWIGSIFSSGVCHSEWIYKESHSPTNCLECNGAQLPRNSPTRIFNLSLVSIKGYFVCNASGWNSENVCMGLSMWVCDKLTVELSHLLFTILTRICQNHSRVLKWRIESFHQIQTKLRLGIRELDICDDH